MKMIDTTCPNCGSQFKIDSDTKSAVCEHCGKTVLIDDEIQHVQYDNAEEAGYMFEKGRQRAIAEAKQSSQQNNASRGTYQQKPGQNRVYESRPNPGRASGQGSGKSHTWLWVLGWICFFPAPIMVLIWRKKNTWDIKIKIAVTVAFWLVMLIWGASGSKEADSTTTNASSKVSSEYSEGNKEKESTEIRESEAIDEVEAPNKYAEDDIVNQFITDYNATSQYEMTDIEKGNIRTKYFGHTNDCYIEMINATGAAAEAFCISINGGNNDEDTERMYAVFPEFVHTLDSSIADDQIQQAITDFKDGNVLTEGYKLGDTLTITFVPNVKLSYGYSNSRIDIESSSYGKGNTE